MADHLDIENEMFLKFVALKYLHKLFYNIMSPNKRNIIQELANVVAAYSIKVQKDLLN